MNNSCSFFSRLNLSKRVGGSLTVLLTVFALIISLAFSYSKVAWSQTRFGSSNNSTSSGVAAKPVARVQLEIILTQGVAYEVSHSLSRELAHSGIENVTLRQQKPSDAVSLTNTGTEAMPNWRVIAVMESSGSILLPDGTRVSAWQPTELARWIQELPEKMARKRQEEQAPELSDFGLTAAATDELVSALKTPLNFSTKDKKPLQIIPQCIRLINCSVDMSSQQLQTLNELDPVAEELQGLACGTVLAYILRPAGLCLTPHQTSSSVMISVISADKKIKPWPIGFKVTQNASEVLPDMFQMVTAGIENSPAQNVIQSLGERLDVPLLFDYNAMARHGIELNRVLINIPARKMSYNLIFNKVLTRSRLKSELRMDEAGRPFFWITTIQSVSPLL